MMDREECEFFTGLCHEHRLSEKPSGVQLCMVNLFLLSIQIRREAGRLHKGQGEVSVFQRLITAHTSLSDRLGLTVRTTEKGKVDDDIYAAFLGMNEGNAKDDSK